MSSRPPITLRVRGADSAFAFASSWPIGPKRPAPPVIHTPAQRPSSPPSAAAKAAKAAKLSARAAKRAAKDANKRSHRELTSSSRAVVLKQQLALDLRVGEAKESSQFLDLGCGRGLVLLDALDLGATEVVGIDFNRGVEGMMASEIAKRGWTVESHSRLRDGVGYLLVREATRATLRLVIGDLRLMDSPPPPLRLGGGSRPGRRTPASSGTER